MEKLARTAKRSINILRYRDTESTLADVVELVPAWIPILISRVVNGTMSAESRLTKFDIQKTGKNSTRTLDLLEKQLGIFFLSSYNVLRPLGCPPNTPMNRVPELPPISAPSGFLPNRPPRPGPYGACKLSSYLIPFSAALFYGVRFSYG